MSENIPASSQFAQIGEELRISREKAGLSLEDVSSQLRISIRHLEHIEFGDNERLPGSTYLLGFVRSYAKLLKLNADDLCQRIMDALTEEDLKPEFHVVGGGVQKADYRARYVMIGVVLVILAYTGWYLLRGETVSTSGFLSVEESEQDSASPSSSASFLSPEIDEAAGEPASQDLTASTAEGTSDDTPDDSASITESPSEIPSQSPSESQNEVSDTTAADDAKPSPMTIKATSSTWVEVKTQADETLVAKLLAVDEIITIPDDGIYTLTAGNAGGLLIGYQGDDASWKTLGGIGEILQMKVIDHSLLND